MLNFRVIILTDWTRPNLLKFLNPLLIPGVALQHRHHGTTDRQFFDEAEQINNLCKERNVPLFINGHLDVALALGCHLHISQHGLSLASVKHVLPETMLVSASVHSADELHEVTGAHFAIAAPVFSPRSKPGDTRIPLGTKGFANIQQAQSIPIFALGGIDENTATQIPNAHGFALLNSLYEHQNPQQLIHTLLSLKQKP
jgi:thiamine-phosphate pyrophosphorylase